MGNSQSTSETPCHRNPLCRALCLSEAPAAKAADEGEWFGELPREKGKKRRSSKRKSLSKLPSVPEDTTQEESVSSDTVLTSEDNAPNAPPAPRPRALMKNKAASSANVLSKSAPPSPAKKAVQRSLSVSKNNTKKKHSPSVKLTFVRGQFVDASTKRGGEMVTAAQSGEATGLPPVGGIISSIRSGHGGLLSQSSSTMSASTDADEKALGKVPKRASFGLGAGMRRLNSTASETSDDGSEATASSGATALSTMANNVKEAVTSIVALGEGVFLTASRSDRTIKMWKVEKNAAGKPDITFVRNFAGHGTAVTCLARVDAKGRFMSAAKDRSIKLWDSRFNCDDADPEEDELGRPHRRLLATFESADRRVVHSIAITDGGSYVRPTDNVDKAMAKAMAKKALMEGHASVTRAAHERQIIECSSEFATISGRHNTVKMWLMQCIKPEDGQPPSEEHSVAEAKVVQELKHDAVVESIAAVDKGGMLLTGDRMGTVKLWTSSGKNMFLPGATSTWTCARTFSWRRKSDLATFEEASKFAITSLAFLQDNSMFASGSKSGNLRVWALDGTKKKEETVRKEVICITGAHTGVVTAIRPGPTVKNDGGGAANLSFSSASEGGKVLSFAIPAATGGGKSPSCFNVVNHDLANRYVTDADPIGVTALACLSMPNDAKDILVTGSTNDGGLNLLKRVAPGGPGGDALIAYRRAMEEESLTLYAIAEEMVASKVVESKNRKLNMKTYKDVFRGKDAVSFMVDNRHAATREDAVDLGHVLATHLGLFECVTKKCKVLQDDAKSYYRWSSDFTEARPNLRKTESAH